MFIIKPESPEHWADALFILSYYHVYTEIISNGDNTDGMYVVVDKPSATSPEGEDHVRLAEMAFQANWHQEGGICDACDHEQMDVCCDCDIRYSCDDSRGDCTMKHLAQFCGHLTFTKPIKPAF